MDHWFGKQDLLMKKGEVVLTISRE